MLFVQMFVVYRDAQLEFYRTRNLAYRLQRNIFEVKMRYLQISKAKMLKIEMFGDGDAWRSSISRTHMKHLTKIVFYVHSPPFCQGFSYKNTLFSLYTFINFQFIGTPSKAVYVDRYISIYEGSLTMEHPVLPIDIDSSIGFYW